MSSSQSAPSLHAVQPLDNCRICGGHRGGVLGNENVVEGVVVCDYCSARLPTLARGLVPARTVAMHAFGLTEQVGILARKLGNPAADVGTPSEILARMESLLKDLRNLALIPVQLAWSDLRQYLPPAEAQVLAVSRNGGVREMAGASLRELAWAAEREDEECNYTHWAAMPSGPSGAPAVANTPVDDASTVTRKS